MCEFKIGDEVIAIASDGSTTHDMIYLYSMSDKAHVVQPRAYYERGVVASLSVFQEIKPAPKYETRVLGPVAMMQRLVDEQLRTRYRR